MDAIDVYRYRVRLLLGKQLAPAFSLHGSFASRRQDASRLSIVETVFDCILRADFISLERYIRRAIMSEDRRGTGDDWMLFSALQWYLWSVPFEYVPAAVISEASVPWLNLLRRSEFVERCGRTYPDYLVRPLYQLLTGEPPGDEAVFLDSNVAALDAYFETALLVTGTRYVDGSIRSFVEAVAELRRLSSPRPARIADALAGVHADADSVAYAGALAYLRTVFALDRVLGDVEQWYGSETILRRIWRQNDLCMLGWDRLYLSHAQAICDAALGAMARAKTTMSNSFDLLSEGQFRAHQLMAEMIQRETPLTVAKWRGGVYVAGNANALTPG